MQTREAGSRIAQEQESEDRMTDRIFNVLFLCTGNSARSIMAERLMDHWGRGRFKGYSAGSYPTGTVNPLALAVLERAHLPTKDLRSKSWDEFAAPGAPVMDFVFTVCDSAGSEVCPVWPGQPVTAHWGIADPAAVTGSDAEKTSAFREAFGTLENRIKIFTSQPVAKLDRGTLNRQLQEIGRAQPAGADSAHG
jgi:arsenate reductase